jgi:Cft2 family RNA processing exonuclease
MGARLIAVSGLGPKEPAAFVVEADGQRLLLDCGEGPQPGRLPDFDAIGRIDAIILSHGHNDHAGALRLRDRIGSPPVYATAPVITRLPAGVGAHPIPIRGRANVRDIAIETGPNGHAPGGVWLRLAVGAGLLYMGDHSIESALYGFDQPPATATIVFDASYGDAEETQARQRAGLADMAESATMLLPVPADGRAPEIAMFLQQAGFDVAIDAQVRTPRSCSRRPPARRSNSRASRRWRNSSARRARSMRIRRRRASWWRMADRAIPAWRRRSSGAGASAAIPRSCLPAILPPARPDARWWIKVALVSGAGTCTRHSRKVCD